MQGLEMRSRAETTIKMAIQDQEAKAATVQSGVHELEVSSTWWIIHNTHCL